jgi:hypothetical protein
MSKILKEPSSRQAVVNVKTGLQAGTQYSQHSNDYNLAAVTTQSIKLPKGTLKSTGPTVL